MIEVRAKYDKIALVKYVSIWQNVLLQQLVYCQHVKEYKSCDVNKRKTCQNRIYFNFKRHFLLLSIWISINSQSRSVVRNWNKDKLIRCNHHFSICKSKKILLQQKQSPGGVSCEFCEVYKNTFFTEHFQWLLLLQKTLLQCIR